MTKKSPNLNPIFSQNKNKIIITRSVSQSSQTAYQMMSRGFTPLFFALFDIVYQQPGEILPDSLAIITSINALYSLGSIKNNNLSFAVVGKNSADYLKNLKFNVVATDNTIDDLLLKLEDLLPKYNNIYYLRGSAIKRDLKEVIPNLKEYIVYETKATNYQDINPVADAKGVLFYSAKNAQRFVELARQGNNDLSKIHAFCLSNNIASSIKDAGFAAIHVAKSPNESAMLELLSSVDLEQMKD